MRLSDEQLLARWRATEVMCPSPGSRWRHARSGHVYEVVAPALDEADVQPLVVYRAESGVTWARPLQGFLERFDPVEE